MPDLKPMTMEEATDLITEGKTSIQLILRSYALHVATVARPSDLEVEPERVGMNNLWKDKQLKAKTHNSAIADYFTAIKSEIEKN